MKRDFVDAMKRSAGIMAPAMQAIGISARSTIWEWRKEDPAFDAACREATEIALDMAESALMKNIKNGDTRAIKFLLSCKGRERGYVEHSQLDVNATIVRPRIIYDDDPEALSKESRDFTPED